MRRAYAAIIKRKWKGGNRGERWAQKVRNYLGQIENHIMLATPCLKHSFFCPPRKGGKSRWASFFLFGPRNSESIQTWERGSNVVDPAGQRKRRKKKNVFTCAPTNHSRPSLSYPIPYLGGTFLLLHSHSPVKSLSFYLNLIRVNFPFLGSRGKPELYAPCTKV